MHPINRVREQKGAMSNLHEELLLDGARFRTFYRLTIDQFSMLLDMVKDEITKQDTTLRPALQPKLKLAVTLRLV